MFKTLLAIFLVLGVAPSVRALPEFPEELQKATGAPCLPHCNVCHRDDNAGDGTVNRPFVLNMRKVGHLGESKDSIDSAVARLKQAGTDSDGDGAPDIEELSLGDDPNDSYAASICGPHVGCNLGGGTQGGASTGAVLLMLGWILVRRSRAR